MNIVARFNMGKRLNLVQRGSYERRAYLSGLRYNKSFKWHSSPWKKCIGKSPGTNFKHFIKKHEGKKSCRAKLFSRENKNDEKTDKPNPKSAMNRDYGVYADEPEDAEDLNFIMMEAELVVNQLNVSIYSTQIMLLKFILLSLQHTGN